MRRTFIMLALIALAFIASGCDPAEEQETACVLQARSPYNFRAGCP